MDTLTVIRQAIDTSANAQLDLAKLEVNGSLTLGDAAQIINAQRKVMRALDSFSQTLADIVNAHNNRQYFTAAWEK